MKVVKSRKVRETQKASEIVRYIKERDIDRKRYKETADRFRETKTARVHTALRRQT